MLPQITAFQDEADALNDVLMTLSPADWARSTLFKSWTVNDVVQHLHDGDLTAAASAEGPELSRACAPISRPCATVG